MRIIQAATIVAVALCFGAAAANDRAAPQTHTVTIEDMRFQPEVLTVSRGDTIVWVNKDLVPHTATSKAGGFDSKAIGAGQSWRYTAPTQGEFAYVCAFHPLMQAALRVR